MKILFSFPGHLSTVPMNRYVLETLKDLGHDVEPFNFGVGGIYPRMLKKSSRYRFLSYIDSKLLTLAKRFNPDIFLTIFGFDHRKEIIDHLRAMGIITACWWLNDPFRLNRSLRQAVAYDYYFTNAKGSLDDYKRAGIKNVFFLPVGIFPSVHRKIENIAVKYDICFAGDWGPVREEVLTSLADDFNIGIFGPWKKKLKKRSPLAGNIKKGGHFSPEEMAMAFNQSRIVLNIHSWFGKWDYGINPRVFEANGCGSFQISDYKEEIPELYEPGKEIVLYKTTGELKEKLSFYLHNENERKSIASQGYMKTMRCHTYGQRLMEMLHICG